MVLCNSLWRNVARYILQVHSMQMSQIQVNCKSYVSSVQFSLLKTSFQLISVIYIKGYQNNIMCLLNTFHLFVFLPCKVGVAYIKVLYSASSI